MTPREADAEIARLKAELAAAQAKMTTDRSSEELVVTPAEPWVRDQDKVHLELNRWDRIAYLLGCMLEMNDSDVMPDWRSTDQYTWMNNALHSLLIQCNGQKLAASRRLSSYKRSGQE